MSLVLWGQGKKLDALKQVGQFSGSAENAIHYLQKGYDYTDRGLIVKDILKDWQETPKNANQQKLEKSKKMTITGYKLYHTVFLIMLFLIHGTYFCFRGWKLIHEDKNKKSLKWAGIDAMFKTKYKWGLWSLLALGLYLKWIVS